MFISSKDALSRLSSERNLFREGDSPEEQTDGVSSEAICPELVEEGAPEVEHEKSSMDLSSLDDILREAVDGRERSKTRARYRGNLEAQKAIATTDVILGKGSASQMFGLSTAQSQAYGAGQMTTGPGAAKPELKHHIKNLKMELAEKAAHRLGDTLELLTGDRLARIKRATDISKVAKDMAVIVEKMEKSDNEQGEGVHLHIYRPEMNIEQNYQTVVVGVAPDK